MKKINKSSIIPSELENVATTSDIDALDGKLGKCYSSERYEDFQDAVEKIILKTLDGSSGKDKIRSHIKEYFKGQIIYNVVIWIVTLIVGVLIQKFFTIF